MVKCTECNEKIEGRIARSKTKPYCQLCYVKKINGFARMPINKFYKMLLKKQEKIQVKGG